MRESSFVFRWAGGLLAVVGVFGATSLGLAKPVTGFVDFNAYPELTELNTDATFTVNILANLPERFQYFSLSNFINTDRNQEISDDFAVYMEHSLRWKIAEDSAWDLTAQWNFRTGAENDRFRLGARWRLNDAEGLKEIFESWHLSYSINFHVWQKDYDVKNVWQMEHAFRKTFPNISERLYIGGFVDHTFNESLPVGFPDSPIVGEAQLGWRLADDWYAIAEYRYNGYRIGNEANLALGVEYVWRF